MTSTESYTAVASQARAGDREVRRGLEAGREDA